MEIITLRVASDKKVAEFLIGSITYLGYYHPDNKRIFFETKSECQILDPQKTKLSKKDYSALLKKAAAILEKR